MSTREKRKFLRVDTNLYALLNRQVPVAIKRLSVGGCLIEAPKKLSLSEPVHIDFAVDGEHLRLSGQPVYARLGNQMGIEFKFKSEADSERLARLVEKYMHTPINVRPTRIPVQAVAILNQQPSTVSNLSIGGCFLETKTPFSPGDIIEVHSRLDQNEMYVMAQVRWQNPLGVGVEFLSTDPESLEIINAFITRRDSKPSR